MTGQIATFTLAGISDRTRGDPRFSRVAIVVLISLAHGALFLLATRDFTAAPDGIVAPAPMTVRWIEAPAEAGQPATMPKPPLFPVIARTKPPHPAVTSAEKPRAKTIFPPPSPQSPVEDAPNLPSLAETASSEVAPADAPMSNAPPSANRDETAPSVTLPRVDAAYLSNPTPDYPSEARRTHQEGNVLLRVLVAADGHVQDVSMERGCGFPLLDDAAAAAVRKWRFTPGRRGDTAVDAWVFIPIFFKLRA